MSNVITDVKGGLKFNFFNFNAILKFNTDIIGIIADCYSASNAQEKLKAIVLDISNLDVPDETKLFLIKDLISRPKKNRLFVSDKLKTYLRYDGDSY